MNILDFSTLFALTASDQLIMSANWLLNFMLMLFFFGFCIFIHEFGHLLAALHCKMHVERFSVGFGKAIKKWTIKGVEYWLSWIPFGGYVALPQLEPTDNPKSFDGEDLPEVRPIDRIYVAFAGPFFNIVFALLLATLIWIVGMDEAIGWKSGSVTVGYVPQHYKDHQGQIYETPEYLAGLQEGDEIVAINDEKVTGGWPQLAEAILFAPGSEVKMDIIRDGAKKQISYRTARNPERKNHGFPFFRRAYDHVIAYVPDPTKEDKSIDKSLLRPTWEAGLRTGDELETIYWGLKEGADPDDPASYEFSEPVKCWSGLQARLDDLKPEALAESAEPAPILLAALRRPEGVSVEETAGELKYFAMRPAIHDLQVAADKQEKRWVFGLSGGPAFKKYHRDPIQQLHHVLAITVKSIRALIDSRNHISLSDMSGPLGIGHAIHIGFSYSLLDGLRIVAIISFSLAIFNLLPIPILDGGHISLAVIEIITKRKVPERVLRPVFTLFIAVLISFAIFVTFHDAGRIMEKPPPRQPMEPNNKENKDAPAEQKKDAVEGEEKADDPEKEPEDSKDAAEEPATDPSDKPEEKPENSAN